jgi:hypothetical protein
MRIMQLLIKIRCTVAAGCLMNEPVGTDSYEIDD